MEYNNQIEPTNTPTPPPVIAPKKKTPWLTIGLIILFSILVGGGIFYWQSIKSNDLKSEILALENQKNNLDTQINELSESNQTLKQKIEEENNTLSPRYNIFYHNFWDFSIKYPVEYGYISDEVPSFRSNRDVPREQIYFVKGNSYSKMSLEYDDSFFVISATYGEEEELPDDLPKNIQVEDIKIGGQAFGVTAQKLTWSDLGDNLPEEAPEITINFFRPFTFVHPDQPSDAPILGYNIIISFHNVDDYQTILDNIHFHNEL